MRGKNNFMNLQYPYKNGPWQVVSGSQVYENPWIKVIHEDVLHPDGSKGIYGTVHFRNWALGVVALNEAGQVLLVGQWRYPLQQYSWEIPEGGGSLRKPLLASMQRELQEETGYSARNWESLGTVHTSNSVCCETGFIWLATDLQAGVANPEGSEELQVRWVPLAEALSMVMQSQITDSLSVAAILKTAHLHPELL
jgi:8-oxo-dGTP pyrophosphatase MutT (NUDIX family)